MFFGLLAAGKSTLTAHSYWLDEPEETVMLQDDVCTSLPDGGVAGIEGNGMYVKTIGLDPEEQPTLYDAVTHESAVLENMAVDEDGTVNFDSDEYTSNGRAVILREHLTSADRAIDLDNVDQVFFITRNPMMPPVVRFSSEQAAVAFMLGESIQTGAGDPANAGTSIRVAGRNPFIIGSNGEEGNRFRDLVDGFDVDCYLLNTGHVGHESRDISVEYSVTLLRELARGTVEWTDHDELACQVPRSVPGMDIKAFADLATLTEQEKVYYHGPRTIKRQGK